jgi:hypothetical protein
MSALWKQCQQGSSNERWAKYTQAAALALLFPSETRFTTPLADAPQHDMSRKEEFGPGCGKNGGGTAKHRVSRTRYMGWEFYSVPCAGTLLRRFMNAVLGSRLPRYF